MGRAPISDLVRARAVELVPERITTARALRSSACDRSSELLLAGPLRIVKVKQAAVVLSAPGGPHNSPTMRTYQSSDGAPMPRLS